MIFITKINTFKSCHLILLIIIVVITISSCRSDINIDNKLPIDVRCNSGQNIVVEIIKINRRAYRDHMMEWNGVAPLYDSAKVVIKWPNDFENHIFHIAIHDNDTRLFDKTYKSKQWLSFCVFGMEFEEVLFGGTINSGLVLNLHQVRAGGY